VWLEHTVEASDCASPRSSSSSSSSSDPASSSSLDDPSLNEDISSPRKKRKTD
jgi:hypothetical protein